MLQDELLKTYEEIDQAIEDAPESTVPFPVVKDEKLNVVGDANETQINKKDFKIKFKFPKGSISGKDEEVVKEVEYNNIFISPRRSIEVISIMCRMMPFFHKIDGTDIEKYSRDEMMALVGEYGHVFARDMYDLVACVLGIDEKLYDFIEPVSAMQASVQIFREFPEVVNEAETFF